MVPASVRSTQWLPFGTMFSAGGVDCGGDSLDASFNVDAGPMIFCWLCPPPSDDCGKTKGPCPVTTVLYR